MAKRRRRRSDSSLDAHFAVDARWRLELGVRLFTSDAAFEPPGDQQRSARRAQYAGDRGPRREHIGVSEEAGPGLRRQHS